MTSFDRTELDDMARRWLAANREAERIGDWRQLARFYTDDATYGWNVGTQGDVMCVGVDEIREIALGREMDGLLGWHYPYERVLIDEAAGELVGFWKQIVTLPDGSSREVHGLGASWFGYAGNGKFAWQRDVFDRVHVTNVFAELISTGMLTPQMQARINRSSSDAPLGYYPLGQTPAPLWPE
ncbi:hypothetical protein [Mycobacterium sp. 3519A]|jgi:hypothetical protein|uniref:hypothetical protein n=1 Tax=Mycobacterium sp. 3519A TaxID=2057184 RepID=UPI000C7E1E3B|nr:hypothetical protein [Mycobacterium sp. 3519A]